MHKKRVPTICKAIVFGISIAMSAPISVARSLTQDMLGIGALVGGAALFAAAQKGCHPVKDRDTGMVNWQCDKGTFAGISGATQKTAGTYILRKALDAERTSSGLPPDPEDCDAHHIVPKGESRLWAKEMVTQAREAIEGCVEIDSASNGVYLPNKKTGSASCNGSYHKTLHTKTYYSELQDRLVSAKRFEGCDGVERELFKIKQELVEGGKW